MKKLGSIVGIVLLMLLCVTVVQTNADTEEPQPAPPVQRLIVEIDSGDDDSDGISRSMSIDNPEASLSGSCSIIGEVGYFHIWGTITSTETRNFWMDTQILKERLGITKIRVYINSPGGSGQDGLGLADLISSAQAEGFEIEAYATGMIASAAVPVLAACGKRVANPGCMFMVHQAKLFKYLSQESAADLAAQGKMMEILTTRYISILGDNTKRKAGEWLRAMERTTWFTAKEALKWGLIDEIK